MELTDRSARRRTTSGVALLVGVVAAGVACGAALLLAGGAPSPAPAGLADPGPVVGWGRRAAEAATLLASVLTVGALLVAGALVPPGSPTAIRARRAAAVAAWAWTATALLAAVLEACDLAGVPLRDLDLAVLQGWLDQSSRLLPLMGAVLTGVIAASIPVATTRRGTQALLVLALLDAAVLGLDGHAAGDSELVQSGIVVHVVAALLWTGGLAGLLLHVRRDRAALQVAAPRFSRLALACFVATAGSGILTALGTLPWSVAAWSSGYAGIVAAKVGVLLALGLAGHRHRTRTLPRLRRGDPRAFLRLAAGEVVVMGAGLGLAAALARTPLPSSAATAAHGHPGGQVVALTWGGMLTEARPNAVVLLVLGLAWAGYVTAARSLSSAGGWPGRRSAAFGAALVATLVATCSGMAAYAHTRPSILVAQLLTMLGVVPALALLGRPVELARRAGYDTSSLHALRALVTPASGAVAASLLVLALQHTPVVELAIRQTWYHLLLLALTAVVGAALLWPALGTAGTWERGAAERAGWLAVVGLCLLVFAARLRFGDGLLAEEWFLDVRLQGAHPVADQRLAGLLAGAAGLALLTPLLLVTVRGPRPQVTDGPTASPSVAVQRPEPHDHGAAQLR